MNLYKDNYRPEAKQELHFMNILLRLRLKGLTLHFKGALTRRKSYMNYFELFELPIQLKADRNIIKRKYFELSKKHHPDYFISSDESQQQQALETSALLNKGLKTLSHVDDTIAYVLKLKGLLEEEEKYQLPPDFLMEMMEINEEVAEADFNSDPNKKVQLFQQLTQLENDIYEPVKEIIENYKDGVTTTQELLQVKDYYFKKKYLHRLYQQLNGKL